MKLSVAVFLAMVSLGGAQAQPVTSRPEAFGFWSAVCDGIGECTAWGVGDPESQPGYVIATLTKNRRSIRLSAGGWGLRQGEAYRLTAQVVNSAGGALWSGNFTGRKTYSAPSALVRDADMDKVAAALAQGAEVRLFLNGALEPAAVVSLKGSAAALLWAKEQAKRRTYPAVLRRAPRIDQRNLPKAIKGPQSGCDLPEEKDVSVARLTRGKIIWIVTCRTGYNNGSQIYLTDEAGRRLPGAGIEAEGIKRLEQLEMDNIQYDPVTRTLQSTRWEIGRGGCGSRTEWVWDGTAFRRSMVSGFNGCHEVDTNYWPVRYRARVINR